MSCRLGVALGVQLAVRLGVDLRDVDFTPVDRDGNPLSQPDDDEDEDA